ncbi:MAG: hypothetical protein GC190_21035 [Alphaproteobacteria bacterium]|nr:hypothetical protein [Alphaproteobacteria bacterium]
MSRISIYVPQVAVPGLRGPEIKPINGAAGFLDAAQSVLQALDARNRRQAAGAMDAQPDGGDPADEQASDAPPPASHKDGVGSVDDPRAGAVNAIEAKQKQDASAYAALGLARLAETGLNAARAGTEAAVGHTLGVNEEFTKTVAELLANAPNDFATRMLVHQVPRVHSEVQSAAIAAEANANVARRYADAMETLSIFGRLVAIDPSQVLPRFKEAKFLTASLVMSPRQRATFEEKLRELPLIALSATIDRDPKRAVTEIKQGRWSGSVDADTLNSMKATAERQISLDESNAAAESEFNAEHLRLDLDKFGKALLDGQTTSNTNPLNAPERFAEVLGKDAAKSAAATVAAQRDIGKFFANAQILGRHEIERIAGEAGQPGQADDQREIGSQLLPRAVIEASHTRPGPQQAQAHGPSAAGGNVASDQTWPWGKSPVPTGDLYDQDDDVDWTPDPFDEDVRPSLDIKSRVPA